MVRVRAFFLEYVDWDCVVGKKLNIDFLFHFVRYKPDLLSGIPL